MMPDNQPSPQQVYANGYNNREYVTNDNILRLRLDTETVTKQIELYLKGIMETIEFDPETGNPYKAFVKISEPKANMEGIHSICSWIKTVVNTQVAQGNFDSKENVHEIFVHDFRLDYSCYLMTNLYNFDIAIDEYEGIIDMTLNLVGAFLTRLIDNKERDSYSATMRHIETTNIGEKKKSFHIPGFSR